MRSGAALAFASVVVACGARSALVERGGSGAFGGASASNGASASGASESASAGGSSGDLSSTSSSSTGAGGGDASCVHWSLATTTPVAITDASNGDSVLTGFAVDAAGVFVATMNDDTPSTDATWRVRVVSPDLSTIGPSQIVATHSPSALIGGLGLASDGVKRGGLLWDAEQGCRFFSIADDGSALGSTNVGADFCYWLDATPSGFVAAQSPMLYFAPLDWLGLDASGAVVSTANDIIPAQPHDTTPLRRVRFSDATELLTWGAGSNGVGAERIDAAGNALSGVATPLTLDLPYVVGLASLGARGMLAWAASISKDQLFARPIDEDANALGPDVTLAEPDGLSVNSIDLAKAGSGALVAWTKGQQGAPAQISFVPVDASGAPIDAISSFPAPASATSLRIARVQGGAIVIFVGVPDGATTVEVLAVRLTCGP